MTSRVLPNDEVAPRHPYLDLADQGHAQAEASRNRIDQQPGCRADRLGCHDLGAADQVAVVFASGERKGELYPADAIRFCGDNGVTLAALSPTDYAAPLVRPIMHTDPFDEMLLVHAQQLGAKLLTRDDRLSGHALAASPV